jgi:hypothetical protein
MWLRAKVNSPTILPHTASVCIWPRYGIMHTESRYGIQTYWALLRYSYTPILLAASRKKLSLNVAFLHWASLQYPDTLSLIAVFLYTEPHYGIQTQWLSLRYPCTLSITKGIMFTEPDCCIRAYSLAALLYTLSLTTVSIHTEPHCGIRVRWASIRYPHSLIITTVFVYIKHYYGVMQTEPCCDIRAYSLTSAFLLTEPSYCNRTVTSVHMFTYVL